MRTLFLTGFIPFLWLNAAFGSDLSALDSYVGTWKHQNSFKTADVKLEKIAENRFQLVFHVTYPDGGGRDFAYFLRMFRGHVMLEREETVDGEHQRSQYLLGESSPDRFEFFRLSSPLAQSGTIYHLTKIVLKLHDNGLDVVPATGTCTIDVVDGTEYEICFDVRHESWPFYLVRSS